MYSGYIFGKYITQICSCINSILCIIAEAYKDQFMEQTNKVFIFGGGK